MDKEDSTASADAIARIVDAGAAVDAFCDAPAVDWTRMRNDLDDVVDQDITPPA